MNFKAIKIKQIKLATTHWIKECIVAKIEDETMKED